MKNNLIRLLVVLICVFTVMQVNIFAQQNENNAYDRYKQERDREKMQGNVERNLKLLRRVSENRIYNDSFDPYVPPFESFDFFGPYALPARRPVPAAGSFPKNTPEIESRLEIRDGEISPYKTFLGFPKTGAFKLLPFTNCSTLTEKENCYEQNRAVWVFASAFSFREEDHKFFSQADLIKRQNLFETSKNANQSVFVNLGDVSLENLNLNSAGMDYLVNFVPARKAKKVNEQYEQIAKGVKIGNYEYAKSLPIEKNMTYALRSVAYKDSMTSPGEIADVIVAFRVVNIADDGAITIVWKELSRKDGVKLKG